MVSIRLLVTFLFVLLHSIFMNNSNKDNYYLIKARSLSREMNVSRMASNVVAPLFQIHRHSQPYHFCQLNCRLSKAWRREPLCSENRKPHRFLQLLNVSLLFLSVKMTFFVLTGLDVYIYKAIIFFIWQTFWNLNSVDYAFLFLSSTIPK